MCGQPPPAVQSIEARRTLRNSAAHGLSHSPKLHPASQENPSFPDHRHKFESATHSAAHACEYVPRSQPPRLANVHPQIDASGDIVLATPIHPLRSTIISFAASLAASANRPGGRMEPPSRAWRVRISVQNDKQLVPDARYRSWSRPFPSAHRKTRSAALLGRRDVGIPPRRP